MLLIIGITMVVGIIPDIMLNGYSGIHSILLIVGFLLIATGSGLHKRYVSKLKLIQPKLIQQTLARVLFPAAFIIVLMLLFVLGSTLFPPKEIHVNKIVNRSITLHTQGDTVSAYNLLQKLSLEQPMDSSADIQIGMNFYKQKRFDEAIKKFSALVEKLPYGVEAKYNLGRSRMAIKDWQGAMNDLKSLVLFEPHHAPALEALGDVYWGMNDAARSIYYYKLAEREAPKSYSAYIKLGFAFLKTNSLQHALLEFEKARIKATTEDEKQLITNIINEAKKQATYSGSESQ